MGAMRSASEYGFQTDYSWAILTSSKRRPIKLTQLFDLSIRAIDVRRIWCFIVCEL